MLWQRNWNGENSTRSSPMHLFMRGRKQDIAMYLGEPGVLRVPYEARRFERFSGPQGHLALII